LSFLGETIKSENDMPHSPPPPFPPFPSGYIGNRDVLCAWGNAVFRSISAARCWRELLERSPHPSPAEQARYDHFDDIVRRLTVVAKGIETSDWWKTSGQAHALERRLHKIWDELHKR
jgi:hypothetical protein